MTDYQPVRFEPVDGSHIDDGNHNSSISNIDGSVRALPNVSMIPLHKQLEPSYGRYNPLHNHTSTPDMATPNASITNASITNNMAWRKITKIVTTDPIEASVMGWTSSNLYKLALSNLTCYFTNIINDRVLNLILQNNNSSFVATMTIEETDQIEKILIVFGVYRACCGIGYASIKLLFRIDHFSTD